MSLYEDVMAQRNAMSENIVEKPIVPYRPTSSRVLNEQAFMMFVPMASPGQVGLAAFDPEIFSIESHVVTLRDKWRVSADDLLEKLDKNDGDGTHDLLYAVGTSGRQWMYPVATTPEASTIAARGENGTLKGGEAVESTDLTPLGQMKRHVAAELAKINSGDGVATITSIDTIYATVSDLPASALEGTRYIVEADESIYEYNGGWHKAGDLRENTLYFITGGEKSGILRYAAGTFVVADREAIDEALSQSTAVSIEGVHQREVALDTYVKRLHGELVNGAPEALDTLYELAKALGDDPNFATTVMTEIGKKVEKTGKPSRLYGTSLDGSAYYFGISQAPVAEQVAFRTTGGQLRVGKAVMDDAAVTLAQMNEALGGKLDKVDRANIVYGTDGLHNNAFYPFSDFVTAWTIAYRRANGSLRVGNATDNTDAVPLAQLNTILDERLGSVETALDEILALQAYYTGETFDELHEYAEGVMAGGEA